MYFVRWYYYFFSEIYIFTMKLETATVLKYTLNGILINVL